MKFCPVCGARSLGKIGRERYFCHECYHEWTGTVDNVRVYQVLSDGSVAYVKAEPSGALGRVRRRRAG